jgi:hypothetical protein
MLRHDSSVREQANPAARSAQAQDHYCLNNQSSVAGTVDFSVESTLCAARWISKNLRSLNFFAVARTL